MTEENSMLNPFCQVKTAELTRAIISDFSYDSNGFDWCKWIIPIPARSNFCQNCESSHVANMEDQDSSVTSHKEKKNKKYSALLLKLETVEFAERYGNRPAASKFSVVPKRIWEWRSPKEKFEVQVIKKKTRGSQRKIIERLAGNPSTPEDLEEQLHYWIYERRSKVISYPDLPRSGGREIW